MTPFPDPPARRPREVRSDGMPVRADDRLLRRMLAAAVGMPHTYFDDGEASGQEHGITIDFMREDAEDIDLKLSQLTLKRFEEMRQAMAADAFWLMERK